MSSKLPGRARLGLALLLVVMAAAAASLATERSAQAWPVGTEGCTLGFWKNHTSAWVGYSPTDTIGATFNLTTAQTPYASNTLLEGLNFGGGKDVLGGERILFKQAIAGLLNVSAGLDYGKGTTTTLVINMTRNAILSGDRNISLDVTVTTGNGALAFNKSTAATTITLAQGTATGANNKIGFTKGVHVEAGDLLFGDGHVDQDSTGRLRDAIRDVFINTGITPMTLLMPNNNGVQ